MEDGLYQVTTPYLCAGFVVEHGVVTGCAPILRKKLAYWITQARSIPATPYPCIPSFTPQGNTIMSLLANLATDSSIADEKDSVGGNGPLDSGLYAFTVALAYITKSAGGATGLVLNLKTADNREVRQTLWMTSGTAKGGKNFYEKDGQKYYLPGFNHANSLALLTVGKEISQCDTETKVVNLYSFEAKAEVPTKVEVVMDLMGKEIVGGLLKQTVDKNQKNDATGAYEPTGETRDENEIDKFFRAKDRMTTAEIRAQATEAAFAATWEAKWAGKTRDRSKGAANGGTAGAPKLGAAAAASKKPATSLFA